MEPGALIAGRYELTELLGRGGMGEVWAGRDRDLHRNVAVKLLRRDDDAPPELIQRFEREAVAAAQINHPNIVALYDRGIHDDLHFLVMERVGGTSLAQYLHRQGPLDVDRALGIAQGICAALVAAHEANVVHYDIKPSNVMLTANGSVKVVDFGIAGFTHTHTFTVAPTTTLSPVGTAQYGAPEQFLDRRGDERSDLYALGSVLFALLTGESPFGDGSPLSVIRRKLDEEPREVTGLRPDVPAPVARLLTDLLRRDPEERPGTATAVLRRLTHLRTDTAVRDTREIETETAPPLAPTPTLRAAHPEVAGAAHDASANAGLPTAPVPARRWAANRRVQLLAALSAVLVLAAAAIAYYPRDRHHDAAGSEPGESVATASQYRRMPDFCGYERRNEMRGRHELGPDEPGMESANNSTKANCGWGTSETKKANRSRVIISAELYGRESYAKDEMAAIKPGRTTIDVTLTTSEAEEQIADEAMQTVADETRGKTDKGNDTWIHFRRDNLIVTVWYSESRVPLDAPDNKGRVTSVALSWARSLNSFLEDEPENHEKPVWG